MHRWIDSRILPMQQGPITKLTKDTKKLITNNGNLREYLLKYDKGADFNISDKK